MSPGCRLWRVGLLAALLLCGACSRKPSPEQAREWDAELQRLQAEQDSLRGRAAELAEMDPGLKRLPEGDLVISVPTAFLRSVTERVFSDVAGNITLRLGGIKAHVAKSVKKVVKVGDFVLDVDIQEVVGRLHPGRPEVTFGGNKISMSLPIEIVEGHGRALLHFVWNGKNIADMACGDLDVTQEVSGDVIPASHLVSGVLNLSSREREVVGAFVFPETRLRIRVKPSKKSWDAIYAILEEKKGVCGWVLDKVDVPKLLIGVVEEKGFNVKLPLDKIKPFVVPVGVRDSIRVGDRMLSIDARTNQVRIERDAVWYSADVDVKGLPAAAAVPDSIGGD